MRTKGIGPQGLGIKGNNGYHIGSPAKQTTAAEFAYEKSLKDKEMGKSTKVVDREKRVQILKLLKARTMITKMVAGSLQHRTVAMMVKVPRKKVKQITRFNG